MANLRLVLEVEVQSGKKGASKYSAPGLWQLLKRIPREHWPVLIRGDRDWGTEGNMQRAEQEGLPYLFKLRTKAGTRRVVERLMLGRDWADAGQGWQGAETELRLSGWGRARRANALPQMWAIRPTRTTGWADKRSCSGGLGTASEALQEI